jgi:signal peptide peptidase SppA
MVRAAALKGAPYLSQYFGPWAIEETQGHALAKMARELNLSVHLESGGRPRATSADRDPRGKRIKGDGDGAIAVIELCGPLMKQASSLTGGSSTIDVRREIRDAKADPRVSGICLVIDSPGGTVAGTQELADDVAAAAKIKPLYAQVEDLCASAAYWIASQAARIYANRSALLGAIGTYSVVCDESGAAKKDGVKVHVVRAGDFKGVGTPGTEITDEHLQYMQETVDGLNRQFLRAVASGRALSMLWVRGVADGKAHIADRALELKLIDGIQSRDKTIQALQRACGGQEED